MGLSNKTALEFFAGIGLARMGLERVGWTINFANDIDPKKQEMYQAHYGQDSNYVRKNIFDLSTREVPDAELAWASFPCVDLSLAGNREGLRGHSSSAYWGFHDVLDGLGARRPPLVVLENVYGMLTSHGGDDLATLISSLNSLGYRADVLHLNADHFVPQSRARLFIIGVREPYCMPQGEPEKSTLRPQTLLSFRRSHSYLDWGLAPVGALPARRSSLADMMDNIDEASELWWDEPSVEKLLGQMHERHRVQVEQLAARPSRSYATIYRRMRPVGYRAEVRTDGIAGCLRTPRGGSSRQFVLELGFERIRARRMTAAEYARLQGAGEFNITVPELQALFGFGDAVCVPAVEWLAANCLEPLRRPDAVAARQLALMA